MSLSRAKLIYLRLILSLSMLVPLLPLNDAYGMRLTLVKHLFDITRDFKEPSDVAVSRDGMIYVVDGVNNKIKVFNPNGNFAFSFGGKGAANGEFKFPLGIYVDGYNKVYVADSGNQRVQIFSSSGTFINQIKIPSQNGFVPDPTDVVVDLALKTLFVADNNNHCVLAFNLPAGQLHESYGVPGEGNREFRYPFLMTRDNDNYLYIVDVINTRVQMLSPAGLFVGNIGGWGVEKGQFFRPKGVALDNKDNIYVSDSYMGVIQVFDQMGEFFSAVGDADTKNVKKFTTPAGIFIDGNNKLYVVEMFAEKVSVYSIVGNVE